MKNSTVSWDT